jgi:hypothetical protein
MTTTIIDLRFWSAKIFPKFQRGNGEPEMTILFFPSLHNLQPKEEKKATAYNGHLWPYHVLNSAVPPLHFPLSYPDPKIHTKQLLRQIPLENFHYFFICGADEY